MIRLLPHANEAMKARGISLEWVEAVLRAPDWTEPDPRHPERRRSYKAIADFKGRILRVVHWQEGDDIVVLTVYPDRDALRNRQRR
jgi:hypothetical protein